MSAPGRPSGAGGGMPVFVVSLADAAPRRAALEAELRALALGFEVVPAVDGRAGLPDAARDLVDRAAARARLGRELRDVEAACALSHQAIYARMLAEDIPAAVILEDDTTLCPDFAEIVRAGVPAWADMVMLDHRGAWARVRRGRPLGGATRACPLAMRTPSLTSGYMLTREAARFLRCVPLDYVADWPRDLLALRSFAAVPQAVNQRGDVEVYIGARARAGGGAPARPGPAARLALMWHYKVRARLIGARRVS